MSSLRKEVKGNDIAKTCQRMNNCIDTLQEALTSIQQCISKAVMLVDQLVDEQARRSHCESKEPEEKGELQETNTICLLYTSPSPRDA